jgi:hypothetical protein
VKEPRYAPPVTRRNARGNEGFEFTGMDPRIFGKLNKVVRDTYKRLGQYDYDKYVQYTPMQISDIKEDGIWNYAQTRSSYVGQTQNERTHCHGRGIRLEGTGKLYEGYWANNMKNGHGRTIFTKGDVYLGETRENNAHGRGCMTFADGGFYNGDWYQSMQHGNGHLENAYGVYIGQFQNDQ